MESMGERPRRRRSFTPEFKAEIVGLCQQGDRSVGQVARDFDLTETAVREWVKQAERDAGTRSDGGLTSAEQQELARLRRENRQLREDVEILSVTSSGRASCWRSPVPPTTPPGLASPRAGTGPTPSSPRGSQRSTSDPGGDTVRRGSMLSCGARAGGIRASGSPG